MPNSHLADQLVARCNEIRVYLDACRTEVEKLEHRREEIRDDISKADVELVRTERALAALLGEDETEKDESKQAATALSGLVNRRSEGRL